MPFDSLFGDEQEQRLSDLAVCEPAGRHLRHAALAGGKRVPIVVSARPRSGGRQFIASTLGDRVCGASFGQSESHAKLRLRGCAMVGSAQSGSIFDVGAGALEQRG
jgi:hypothetical protein